MVKACLFLVVILILALGCGVESLQYENDKYSNTDIGFGNGIVVIDDDHYIIAGSTHQAAYSSRGRIVYGESIVAKIGPNGRVIWEKKYPFSEFNSIIYDIHQAQNGDLLLVTSANESFFERDADKKSYLIRLSKDGEIKWKKQFPGAIKKILSISENDFILAGLTELAFDTSALVKVYQPFLIRCTSSGDLIWKSDYDLKVNSIEKVERIENDLSIRYSRYGQVTSEHFALTTSLKGKQLQLNSIQSHNQLLTYNDRNESVSMKKSIFSGKEEWAIFIEGHTSHQVQRINLGRYISAEEDILVKTRVSDGHICDMCEEDISTTSQFAVDENGNMYITISSIKDDPEAAECLSLSTKAFCNGIVTGLYLIKVNPGGKLDWVKHVKQGLLPLDMKVHPGRGVVLVGASYPNHQSGRSELLFLAIEKNGKIRRTH